MRRVLAIVVVLFVSLGFGNWSVGAQGTPEATPAAEMPSYLAGNAYDLIPKGKDGTLDVVITGPLIEGSVPIVIRNNTDDLLANITASGTARDSSGSLLAAGDSQNLFPDWLAPGQIS